MKPSKRVSQASLLAAFLVAGGTASPAQADANPESASQIGIISSYLGGIGMRDEFAHFLKLEGIKGEDQLKIKLTDILVSAFRDFAGERNLTPPPGIDPA